LKWNVSLLDASHDHGCRWTASGGASPRGLVCAPGH
jgi:hypothetical protein